MIKDPLSVYITDEYLKNSAYKVISNDVRTKIKTYTYLFHNNTANCIKIEVQDPKRICLVSNQKRPYVYINNILTNVVYIHELENLEKYLLP